MATAPSEGQADSTWFIDDAERRSVRCRQVYYRRRRRRCCHLRSAKRSLSRPPCDVPSFKLTIAYDGTDYVGWQRQASGTSIQGLLEEALSGLDSRPVTVIGAGRTDAGVHALGQVAAASLERPIDADRLRRALNARLPASVRVVRAIETTADFHPRFAACAKRYRYRMWQAEVLSPFERGFVWHVPAPLDIAAMDAGART